MLTFLACTALGVYILDKVIKYFFFFATLKALMEVMDEDEKNRR